MRFSGTVGYATSEESAPGVWSDTVTEVTYFGDVVKNTMRREPPPQVPPTLNGNLALENSFSILGDDMAYENFMNMRYVTWMGSRWEITNVDVRRPRLILTIGGLWNGDTP